MLVHLINSLWVILGAIAGALLRYAATLCVPQAVLVVNIIGSFLIGYLTPRFGSTEHLRLLLSVGFLGSLTTFSAYSLEVMQLLQSGQMLKAIAYAVLSVLCCLLACALGFKL